MPGRAPCSGELEQGFESVERLEARLWVGKGLGLRGSAVVVAVRPDLLKLLRSENGCELLSRLLVDDVHLLLHDQWRDRGVAL